MSRWIEIVFDFRLQNRHVPVMFSLPLFFALATGYLLGSLPFGLIIARLFGHMDIRQIGSGNIGATNVLRTGRYDLAVATLLLDSFKAGLAVYLGTQLWSPPYGLYAGIGAIIGHCFCIWLQFRGGKGVACFFGILIVAAWPIALCAAGVWLITAALSRYASLAALFSGTFTPIIAYATGHYNISWMAGVAALIIFIRHKDNIKRLITGEEPLLGPKHG